MPVSSGGGAATAAGATYQSSVAAYLVLSEICNFNVDLFGSNRLAAISFETANPVDDINIRLEQNLIAYLQVKRTLSFSVAPDQEFYKCLDQFVRQWIADTRIHSLVLVTTSDSSKRLTVALPAIIAAIRSGPEIDFRRDQNKTLIRDLDLILSALQSLYQAHSGKSLPHHEAIALLKKIRVLTLDLSTGSSVEQAIYMILSAKGCSSPSLFWGSLISDCTSFAASRRTLSREFINERYGKFLLNEQVSAVNDSNNARKLFEIVSSGELPTGREVVIGTVRGPDSAIRMLEQASKLKLKKNDICIFDFYRFDQNCHERIKFQDGMCILQNGLEIHLIGRSATFVGLERLIERHHGRLQASKSKIVFFRSNITEDLEATDCAQTRRALLLHSIQPTFPPLECCHCGKPISTNDVDFLEVIQSNRTPGVALSHQSCTKTDDRIIGTLYSDFFNEYKFLKNFDAMRWFKNISRGQGAYSALEATKAFNQIMTWSGRSARNSTGTHIVELELADGTSEFSYHRGQLDRFSKSKAESYSASVNKKLASPADKADPLCISDQSIQFGTRSLLLATVGTAEKLRPIVHAHVRKYRSTVAKRYDVRDNWFAPVAYLRTLPDETLAGIGSSTFLITEPLHLDRFLSNWRECGLEFPEYEVPILATDEEFDEFVREIFDQNRDFLINPLFALQESNLKLVNGARLVSMASVDATVKSKGEGKPRKRRRPS